MVNATSFSTYSEHIIVRSTAIVIFVRRLLYSLCSLSVVNTNDLVNAVRDQAMHPVGGGNWKIKRSSGCGLTTAEHLPNLTTHKLL